MINLDYWQAFVGDRSPEEFMRNYGSSDPELCIARFLEDRGNLYGVVNQGSWDETFQAPDQHHMLTVRVYLMSYLDETREEWGPALEAKPPSIPRRYREKFDQEKYPPPPAEDNGEGASEESTTDVAPPVGDDPPEMESETEDKAPESIPEAPEDKSVETESSPTSDSTIADPEAIEPPADSEPSDKANTDGDDETS